MAKGLDILRINSILFDCFQRLNKMNQTTFKQQNVLSWAMQGHIYTCLEWIQERMYIALFVEWLYHKHVWHSKYKNKCIGCGITFIIKYELHVFSVNIFINDW